MKSTTKRTQTDRSIAFKLGVVEQGEKAQSKRIIAFRDCNLLGRKRIFR